MFTIAVGNAFEGVELRGLFDTPEEAAEVAEREFTADDWHVVVIEPWGKVS